MKSARSQCAPARLINHLQEARAHPLKLAADLDDEQMTGERLAIVARCAGLYSFLQHNR